MPQSEAGTGIDPVDRSPGGTHKPEEIVAKLRQVDVFVSQGRSVAEAVRAIGVTQFTYCRWRKEFGGLKTNQVKRLKELEKDRAIEAPLVRATMARERLRKAVSDLTLEKPILREAASGSEGRCGNLPGEGFRPERAEPRAPPVAASTMSGKSSPSRNASLAGFSASTARPSGRCRAGVPTRTR